MRYQIPKIIGEYIPVYLPKGDTYNGEPTQNYQPGTYYPEWIVNDFTIFFWKGEWQIIGITHPRPRDFIDHFQMNPETLHEAEWQLFHAVGGNLTHPDSFVEQPKLLYPQERTGEQREIWAPHILEVGKELHLFYSPQTLRHAVSEDGYHWTRKESCFCGHPSLRDPNVTKVGESYCIIYVAENALFYRISTDLNQWTEQKLLQTNPFRNGCSESPVLLQKEGIFYLFWAIHDGRNGSYDFRTFVFASETIEGLEGIAPLTILDAHAPEIMEENGNYYIASVNYPVNGVSIAPLGWK